MKILKKYLLFFIVLTLLSLILSSCDKHEFSEQERDILDIYHIMYDDIDGEGPQRYDWDYYDRSMVSYIFKYHDISEIINEYGIDIWDDFFKYVQEYELYNEVLWSLDEIDENIIDEYFEDAELPVYYYDKGYHDCMDNESQFYQRFFLLMQWSNPYTGKTISSLKEFSEYVSQYYDDYNSVN